MGYPQEFIDKVLESSNLVDIISQYTQLKPSGRGHMGRCPFPDHREKTASFSVSEAKQVYHCFGCKKSGNVLTFLRDYNGMSFPDAIEFLAQRAGLAVPEIQKFDAKQKDQYQIAQDLKKKQQLANKIAADFYREVFKRSSSDQPVKQYVLKRKLLPETLEEFQIGYAPSEWDHLSQHLLRNNIGLDLAEDIKLVKKRNDGSGYFDLFRDRLMFPIHSATGEVLAFGGRIIEQGEPKYLNSPETDLFHKSKVLYGLAQTAKYIRSEDQVIVVEGYMDLVSLYQSGIKNCVATMGTALTPDHVKILKRITTNVVVLFDGDTAGKMAAERSLTLILAQGLYPKGLVLTDAKDPDEYVVRFGAEALKNLIEKSPDLFKVVLHSWLEDYRGEASDKVKLVDKLKPVFDSIVDARLRSLYAEDVARVMGVTMDWLRQSFKNNQSSNKFVNSQVQDGRSYQNEAFIAQKSNAVSYNLQSSPINSSQNISYDDLGREQKIEISKANKVELMLLQNAIKSRANFEILMKLARESFNLEAQNQNSSDINTFAVENLNNNSFSVEDNFESQEFDQSHQFINEEHSFFHKQILSQIKHLGVKQILENAFQVYRQDVEKFDKLVSLLIDKIDRPDLLFQTSKLDMALMSEFDEEKEQKLMEDLVKRLQQEFIKEQSKQIALNMKRNLGLNNTLSQNSETFEAQKNLTDEQLRKFSELQKKRLLIKK